LHGRVADVRPHERPAFYFSIEGQFKLYVVSPEEQDMLSGVWSLYHKNIKNIWLNAVPSLFRATARPQPPI
jgi:hypothetical protein